MDLFEASRQQQLLKTAPLALRMRPQTLSEFAGQEKIVGVGTLLRRAIESDQLQSLIFFGPSGTGKTTLARIIANTTRAEFQQLNAVTSGVAELRKEIEAARERMALYNRKTILFVDEIHRFNKAQQDALLPAVEEGMVILIGATTENPYFEVNSALLSRSRVFEFCPLQKEVVRHLLERALVEAQRGLGDYHAELTPEALDHLVATADGDVRVALNALELAVTSTPPNSTGQRIITLEVAEESIQRRAVRYNKGGNEHYDVVSAFIKSLRGSDADAAVHWLARMLDAGEDPRFIARRMVILAAEDVGLADPHALQVATAAAQALEFVGLPEGRLPLAEAAIYLATAPKSNAVIMAIDRALEDIKRGVTGEVPAHLCDTHFRGAKELGCGLGYKYPHDYPGNRVDQQYLPDELEGVRYYHPGENGFEKTIQPRLQKNK